MKNKLIIQTARLDNEYQKKLNFYYNYENTENAKEVSGEYALTSSFFKEKVLSNQADILFLFPISLPIQNFKNLEDEFLNECQKVDIKKYLDNPCTLINKHPHLKNEKFLIVPSIGKYIKENNEPIIFESNLETISLFILFYLYKNIQKIEEVYIDISSGHNIYITALISTISRFIPIYELHHGFKIKLKVQIIYSEPITRFSDNNSYQINQADFSARTFMDLPYKDFTSIESFLKKYLRKKLDKVHYDSIKEFYEKYFPILFYAVKNAFVLLLGKLLKKIQDTNKLDITNMLTLDIRDNLKKDYLNIVNILIANAMFDGIKESFQSIPDELRIEIKFGVNNKVEKDNVTVLCEDEIKKCFRQYELQHAYQKFKYELYEIFFNKLDYRLFHSTDEFGGLNNLLKNKDNNKEFKSRNFLAHAGLELNSVEIKIDSVEENGTILLKIRLKDDVLDDKKLKSILDECKK